MKNMITVIIALFLGCNLAFADHDTSGKEKSAQAKDGNTETVVLRGSVMDSETQECLTGVALEIAGTNLKVYTDFDGKFIIDNLESGNYNIIVRFVSYQGHLIENVYLHKGVNTLQPIKLIAN